MDAAPAHPSTDARQLAWRDKLVDGRVGRYVVLERLGVGGMGWVFLAYDPELERKVAIKILRPDRRKGALSNARLMREAQAMAQLAHPNVVAVHDVGTWREQVFVTMEYVAGGTLTAWLEQAREPAEVVAMLCAAGRGLAAAHAAGMVHRDFKPDNVLIGVDGRPRVMDFGLVRAYQGGGSSVADDDDNDDDDDDDDESRVGGSLTSPLTRVGALLGTPCYMAPEQFEGATVDERTDQFAFCLVLYEALWGQRAHAAEGTAKLGREVIDGLRAPRPPGRRVPAWLDAIVERGLALDPSARWPSMDALLSALANDPSVARRRWLGVASALGSLAALVLGVWLSHQRRAHQAIAMCEAEERAVTQLWTPARARTIERAFVATGHPAAATAWTGTRPWLDAYADELARLRASNCTAHAVDETRDADDATLIDACLDERQANFEVLVEVLAQAPRGVVERAVQAASSLPLLESCTDLRRQASALRPPSELRGQLAALERQLFRAQSLRQLDQLDAARELSERVRREAEALGWPPAVARALVELAHLDALAAKPIAARRRAEQAFRKAAVAGGTMDMVNAALFIVAQANISGELELASAWAETTEELLASAGLETSVRAAQLAVARALITETEGKLDEAMAAAKAALALLEARLGPEHPELDTALTIIARVAQNRGDRVLVRAATERRLDIATHAHGPDSPHLIQIYNGVGAGLHIAGDRDGAREYYERGVKIGERVFGPTHAGLGGPLNNLGLLAYDEGDFDTARTYFERALAMFEAMGADSPNLLRPLVNLGLIASHEGRHADALAYFGRCDAVLAALQNTAFDQRETWIRSSHADALFDAGQLDAAAREYARALRVAEAIDGPDSELAVRPLLGLTEIDIERGALAEAGAKLERTQGSIELAAARRWRYDFVRGQLLWATGEREAALALVGALRDAQRDDPDTPFALADLDAWLAEHRGSSSGTGSSPSSPW